MNVVLLMPYANPHMLGWAKLLEKKVNLEIICVKSVKEYRRGYFEHLDYDSKILYLFKNKVSNFKIFKRKVKNADVFICLGMFDIIFFQAIRLLRSECQVYIMSEPFNQFNSRKLTTLRKILGFIIRIYIKEVSFLAIGGKSVKNYYSKLGFEKSAYFNFGYFPEINSIEIKSSREENTIRFLFVGQLIVRKGISDLIYLIKYLNSNYSKVNWSFDIIGDGCLKDFLLKEIEIINDNRVSYRGLIKVADELENYYKSSDILFVPSIFDGWGAVVNEGIGAGLAIVATNEVYSTYSLVFNGMNGFTYDHGDLSNLRKIIDDLFYGKFDLEELKNNSKVVFGEWNPQNAANSFFKLIQGEKNSNKNLLKLL